ncbi:MAG: 16S rRNA (cytosine(967)-C(5))-methyltransferase RsmB [Ruminococcaceae bacterium]|jgi:16S rRNA (cytosine967-C5)-methyltransferase|nr:16S rRNA (cytosine(967)-C(5))-methyltransferase RsmB [Oscillospiraceae bacterium]
MTPRANARTSALRVLNACRTNGAWADAALAAELGREPLNASDAALASRIVYGVLQNRLLLDYRLSAFCSQRLEHLQQPLPDILRIGAYQILLLDKVPDSAAVNESVELAKAFGRAAASGLVNAVLRKLSKNKAQLPPLPEQRLERLCVETSHPRWLVVRMTQLLGEEEAEAFLRADNEIAPVTVQLDPMKTTQEQLIAELAGEGVEASAHPWAPDCLELSGVGDLTTLRAFYRGEFIVQDAAARLVSLVSGVKPGMRVLDACAAPGGKSFSAAFAMRGEGRIVSCDLHENKLKRIRDGAARLGIGCIETCCADARVFRPEWEKAFDAVLCDVPCSGLGIIRKKPDIRYKDPDAFAKLSEVQRAILANAARYVRPGGVLVYSTCTVLPEENEAVTDAFLAENAEYHYEAFELPAEKAAGHITLWPHRHGTDGFYIARMRREE